MERKYILIFNYVELKMLIWLYNFDIMDQLDEVEAYEINEHTRSLELCATWMLLFRDLYYIYFTY